MCSSKKLKLKTNFSKSDDDISGPFYATLIHTQKLKRSHIMGLVNVESITKKNGSRISKSDY